MIVGTVVVVVWQFSGLVDVTGIDPMGVGILASTLAMIIGSLVTQRTSPVPAHVHEALVETDRVGPIPARLLTGQNPALGGQVPGTHGSADRA